MRKRFNSNFSIALCTGCALIAFAFYHTSIAVPAVAFYVTAATICLLPVAYCLVTRKACRKTSNAG